MEIFTILSKHQGQQKKHLCEAARQFDRVWAWIGQELGALASGCFGGGGLKEGPDKQKCILSAFQTMLDRFPKEMWICFWSSSENYSTWSESYSGHCHQHSHFGGGDTLAPILDLGTISKLQVPAKEELFFSYEFHWLESTHLRTGCMFSRR